MLQPSSWGQVVFFVAASLALAAAMTLNTPLDLLTLTDWRGAPKDSPHLQFFLLSFHGVIIFEILISKLKFFEIFCRKRGEVGVSQI